MRRDGARRAGTSLRSFRGQVEVAQIRRLCGEGSRSYLGVLASCLKGQRRKTEREVSRGRSSQDSDEGPNEKESQKI